MDRLMPKVSRRALLIGSAATVAVTALPASAVIRTRLYPPEGFTDIVADTGIDRATMRYMMRYMFLFLYGSQWKRIEATGHDMRDCKLLREIPRT
jgi:hypothetical protein